MNSLNQKTYLQHFFVSAYVRLQNPWCCPLLSGQSYQHSVKGEVKKICRVQIQIMSYPMGSAELVISICYRNSGGSKVTGYRGKM